MVELSTRRARFVGGSVIVVNRMRSLVGSFSSRGVNEVLGWGLGETEFKYEKPFK